MGCQAVELHGVGLTPVLPLTLTELLKWEELARQSQHPAAHGGCSNAPDP